MFKAQSDQDVPEDFELGEEALSMLHAGFNELDTPIPAAAIEANVKQMLTSGTDFDPLARQIAHRVGWMAVPAIASFLVATSVLALRPMPRVPLNKWLASRGVVYKPLSVTGSGHYYAPPPDLMPLAVSADGFSTQISGTDPPTWFRKPLVLNTKTRLETTNRSAVAHASRGLIAPAKHDVSGPHTPVLRTRQEGVSNSEVIQK